MYQKSSSCCHFVPRTIRQSQRRYCLHLGSPSFHRPCFPRSLLCRRSSRTLWGLPSSKRWAWGPGTPPCAGVLRFRRTSKMLAYPIPPRAEFRDNHRRRRFRRTWHPRRRGSRSRSFRHSTLARQSRGGGTRRTCSPRDRSSLPWSFLTVEGEGDTPPSEAVRRPARASRTSACLTPRRSPPSPRTRTGSARPRTIRRTCRGSRRPSPRRRRTGRSSRAGDSPRRDIHRDTEILPSGDRPASSPRRPPTIRRRRGRGGTIRCRWLRAG
mmetsp:Transcript_24450/g.45199  ORF Transcript_24450/g.45199 Transcript_24450/m.45199 type:complete len:268 (-) Transcript_24450:2228-3031(-)